MITKQISAIQAGGFVGGLLIPLAGFLLEYFSHEPGCSQAFTRSGALLVACSLLFSIKSFSRDFDSLIDGAKQLQRGEKPDNGISTNTLIVLLAAIGTLVWGFGDIPFPPTVHCFA